MVSLPIYPGNGRKQLSNIDISSWTNKANIIVPESKVILAEQIEMFSIEEVENFESDAEELTDDETYLIRHEKAFADYMNSSF
jgi:hypothetical protein